MAKEIKTTRSGDRKRHRDAVRKQAPRKPLEGNHIRVRGVRRAEIDTTKLSLAMWLIAKGAVEPVNNEESSEQAKDDRPAKDEPR